MNWAATPLRDLCLPVTKMDPVLTGRSAVRYVDIGGIDGDRHKLTEVPWIDSRGAPSRCRQVLQGGDTVFSTVRPYLEKIALIGDSLDGEFASTGFCVLRPSEALEPRFLFHFACSRGLLDQVLPKQKGVSYPAVLDREVRACSIPLPDPEEQRRIVAVLDEHLSDLADACASLNVAETRASKLPSLLAETQLRMAEQWTSVAEISELVRDGDHNPPKRVASGVPHVTAKGIREGRITFEGCTYISEAGYIQTANRYSPQAGDVIVTCVGTIGRVAVVPEGLRFSADRNLAAIRLGEGMLPGYLACVLESVTLQRTMATVSGSTAQPHLYLRDIRSLRVPYPAIEDQAAAVERYQDARRVIERLLVQLEQQRRRAAILRQSLLAAAFSGRLTGRSSDTDVIVELAEEPA